MPPPPAQNLSLSITNPLILYRALVATKKIKPDPAQHRLALQLQKLYFRLKDYAPEVEYRYRLEKIGRNVAKTSSPNSRSARGQRDGAEHEITSNKCPPETPRKRGVLSSLLSFKERNSGLSLALTRTVPLHDSALAIDSPLGMLLYGEVGRGKSMLLDLLYTSLPSRKKRRWHFNTFMLDVFRRIELSRLERLESRDHPGPRPSSLFGLGGSGVSDHEHVVLGLAKETISESPILFLDEFQMPDRTASKLINSFFTAFFHLGGVLVASSNRMPEELSKAAGIEFGGRGGMGGRGGGGFFGLGWGFSRASEGERAAKTDFGLFLEVLRARCEAWEMEGERDWRREGDDVVGMEDLDESGEIADVQAIDDEESFSEPGTSISDSTAMTESSTLSADSPAHYHINIPLSSSESPTAFENDQNILNPSKKWTPAALTIYARPLHLPETHKGILKSTFSSLCATYLGPADYVSLCSTFHTLILTDVPVLTLTQKNEARRFITLLDALYEARCRLLIEAEAPPDKLFFPETRPRGTSTAARDIPALDDTSDSIISEAFSEIYQDSTAPFRPNISSYTDGQDLPSFTPSLQNPSLQTVLADEDADFGPTYGNGRGHGISNSSIAASPPGPDFTTTTALTGEDERFAYKRARSRLWEMCGRKWWDERLPVGRKAGEGAHPEAQEAVERWWRPLNRNDRFWERQAAEMEAALKDAASATASPGRSASTSVPEPG